MKFIILSVVLALQTITLNAKADDDFLTIEELEKSSLTIEEKGIAAMTLGTAEVVECFSSNESMGIGADSERLRIYRLDMGLTVAIWKNYSKIQVFVNDCNVLELSELYKSESKLTFAHVGGDWEREIALVVKFDQVVPMLGRVGELTFVHPEYEANQICRLK